MNNYKNHFLQTFLTICFLFTFSFAQSQTQCECEENEYESDCTNEKVIESQYGTNITNILYKAIKKSCKVRLANPSGGTHVYYTYPQVFRDIDHKEIILDAGVQLLGIEGGFSYCSQSVLTFDGHDVHDILIRGDYCEGQIKPLIGMVNADYVNQPATGYLVGADNVGDPYRNNAGQPNYVFSDNDADPYFDNTGTPNFITNGSQLKVQQDCEYNDLLCNRKIIVWCPLSWEARHIISLHGVKNFWIEDLEITNASGGDGIHITDDRDFYVSSEIHLDNIDFDENARNGLKITNANCVDLDNLDFYNNGDLAPIQFVTPQAALNIDQNTGPGSTDDFMGTLPEYSLYNITFEHGYFDDNVNRDLSFDIPIDLTLCQGEAKFKADNVCFNHSDNVVYFEQSNPAQNGVIKLHNFSMEEFDNAVVATNAWQSINMSISIYNWSVIKTGTFGPAFNINSNSFCATTTVSDLCKSFFVLDDLCQPASCITQNYSCSPNSDPDCGPGGGNDCWIEIYTDVEEVIDYNCECDYMFMVDESGSVRPDEWEEMNCSITNMMNELDSICMDSCDTRFSMIQWAWSNSQTLTSNFDCSPFEFERAFSGGTDVAAALQFLLTLLGDETLMPNEECFKILLFTDAPCQWSNWEEAGPVADVIKLLFPNVEFIIVDYTSNGQLAECEEVIDVISDEDGESDPGDIIQSEFDCETGVGIEDITDTTYTYTIHVEVGSDCLYPTYTWTAYDGGEILSTSSDGATVTTNGQGYYTVEVECAYGCPNGFTEVIQFDSADISNKGANQSTIAVVKQDRTRYYKGKAYTPYEFELFQLRESDVEIQQINISPNPFVDVLNIHLPNMTDEYNLKIFDTQGKMIQNVNLSQQDFVQVDLNDLSAGLYIVKLLNNNTLESVTHKVLKLSKY